MRHVLPVLQEELQINLEDGLQESHVGTLIQADLMLPDIDDEDLAGGQGKQRALPFKVLIFAAFPTIRTLHVHHQDVLGHLGAFLLVLRHPYSLCRLPPFRFGHDTELGSEEVVEKRGLARRLRSKHRDKMIVEAGLGHVCFLEVVIDIRAVQTCQRTCLEDPEEGSGGGRHT